MPRALCCPVLLCSRCHDGVTGVVNNGDVHYDPFCFFISFFFHAFLPSAAGQIVLSIIVADDMFHVFCIKFALASLTRLVMLQKIILFLVFAIVHFNR